MSYHTVEDTIRVDRNICTIRTAGTMTVFLWMYGARSTWAYVADLRRRGARVERRAYVAGLRRRGARAERRTGALGM
jgi:hypothetical protein